MPSIAAKTEKLFKTPGPQPNGLQAAPDGLWSIDQVNLKIYKQDYKNGEILFEAQTDTEHSSGITLGGGYIWIASTFELKIAKLDPETGKTIAKFDSPGIGVVSTREGTENPKPTGAHGLEWRNGKLYVASPPSQMVHVMNAETWEEEHQFRTPGLRNHGLAWGENGRLWVADTSAGVVSLLDTKDGRIYDLIRVEAPYDVHGLTIHEGILLYCDANTAEVCRIIKNE